MDYDVAMLSGLTLKVVEVARLTGRFLLNERLVFDRSRVEEKNLHDYVSYVDRESERRLVDSLSVLLPGAGFITEEETVSYRGEACLWIIDPLDGTTNYVHDQPPYAVSIALYGRSAGLLLGVVYEPCHDECFYAWKGSKAYLDGKEIRVTDVAVLDKAFVALGFPYDSDHYRPVAQKLVDRLYGYAGGTRLLGSAAAELCYVACGRFDARIEG